MAITKSSFGITNDGEEAFLYRLENTSGAYVTITSFGCRIVSIPAVIVLKDGVEVARTVGFQPKDAMRSFIEEHLN